MIYKELGCSGVKIPAIAQGTTNFGSYANFSTSVLSDRIKAIRYGIELGLNFIDTAELYGGGFSEEVVGQAIAGVRADVFVASKFNPKANVEASFTKSLEGSLKRLKTDYIDLYQIHWPNPFIPLDLIMEALFQATQRGYIRFVGLSNFPLQYVKAAQKFFKGKIVSNQIEYNLLDRNVEERILPYCEKEKMVLLAYSTLNQGRVFGTKASRRVIDEIARKHNRKASQIILRWLVSCPAVVAITKTKNISYIKESAESLNFNLDVDDLEKIRNLPQEEVKSVPLSMIRLIATPNRKIYGSLEEAVQNESDLIPSPAALSRIYLETGMTKPIRLNYTKDRTGRYLYDIDQYDVMDQVKKYWAWMIAYGEDKAIPAFIIRG